MHKQSCKQGLTSSISKYPSQMPSYRTCSLFVFFLTLQTPWTLKFLPYRGTVSAQGNDRSLVVQVPSNEQNVLVWTALSWGIQATHTLCKSFNHEVMSFCCIFKQQVQSIPPEESLKFSFMIPEWMRFPDSRETQLHAYGRACLSGLVLSSSLLGS